MEGSLMAYTVFANGNVLNASQLNDNLMNQSVIVFSSDLARNSAIPAPLEGMVTYLEDVDLITIYSGGKWRDSLSPIGGVLQVVTGSTTTQTSSSSTSYSDTTLQATITPKSEWSNILVLVSQNGIVKSAGNLGNGVNLRILMPDATSVLIGNSVGFTGTTLVNQQTSTGQALYTHETNLPILFKSQFANATAATSVTVQNGSSRSHITLMEIAN
jgi:hypothetical protein